VVEMSSNGNEMVFRTLEAEEGGSVALAFTLTIGAGLFTLIGSLFVFFPRATISKYIGLCLGVATGVIAWEGLVELYHEGLGRFQDYYSEHGFTSPFKRAAWTTIGVFAAGWLTTVAIGAATKALRKESQDEEDSIQRVVEEVQNGPRGDSDVELQNAPMVDVPAVLGKAAPDTEILEGEDADVKQRRKDMMETGIILAVVMFLHNLPEGLSVFFGVLGGTGLGTGVAIAIGLHNIPQGFSVALPIYEATGSRSKAFWWSALSGASQPLASLIGYFALRNLVGDVLYGITFAYASGMMGYVVFKVLFPAAHKCDPKDRYVTWSAFAGMMAIGISLNFFDSA